MQIGLTIGKTRKVQCDRRIFCRDYKAAAVLYNIRAAGYRIIYGAAGQFGHKRTLHRCIVQNDSLKESFLLFNGIQLFPFGTGKDVFVSVSQRKRVVVPIDLIVSR